MSTENKITHITPVLIVKDAAKTLSASLQSLSSFAEVIVYDNGSLDESKKIASSFANVKLHEGEFYGFGPTKNLAADFASNGWILSLDSDEVLSEEFVAHLRTLKLQNDHLYTVLRTNHYKNREIKHCWGRDIIVRLYNKDKTAFTDKKVHEKVIQKDLHVAMLQGTVKHYPYSNISDFIVKLDRYSTIFANDNAGKKGSSPLKAILNANFSFFKTYVLKRGFLDGYAGLVIAFSHMATNFYKYIKLYERNKGL